MAQQEYDDEGGGDWFEQNAPDQYYEPAPQEQQDDGGNQPDDGPQDVFTENMQAPNVGNDGNPTPDAPTGPGEPHDPRDPTPGGVFDPGPSGPGWVEDILREQRKAQADALNRRLGLIDPGNLESYLSGRNTWEGYLADQNARATNYTGNRLLNSQGGNYNNDGTLTPQGIAILRAAGLNPNGTRITPTGTGAPGTPGGGGGSGGGGSYVGDVRNYADFAGMDFGSVPAAFGETYTALERPENLRKPYVAPKWNENFVAPSMEDVQNEPGYALGLKEGQTALERSAAARGSVLSGGTQKATARFGTDYGATKYNEATGRLFDQYKQRYGQFLDDATLGAGERNINENAFNTDSGNNLSQYLTRFNAYQTAIGNTRNAETDVWNRNQDLVRNALSAAALARPF